MILVWHVVSKISFCMLLGMLTQLEISLYCFTLLNTSVLLFLKIISIKNCVFKELSDCKETQPLVDVWKSATTMSGAQCVMIYGDLLMLKWHADN